MIRQGFFLFITSLLLASTVQAAPRGDVYDVLDTPAAQSSRAAQSRLFGLARAGDRLVAVGERGRILYSDDQGDSWTQAQVPVSSTLLSVCFPTPELGWATGHDGVVLSSRDGGESWSKVLDGYEAVELGLDYYHKLVEENPGSEEYTLLLSEMEFAVEQGADRPFFFTYFEDARRGFLVGAYGLMLATFDGGESWQPILELSENWGFRHLFDYERVGDTYYLTGEMGLVMYQEERKTRVKTVIPFYDGSFYTMISTENGELIVAGMRANAFRSVDGGLTWQFLELPTESSVVGSTRLADGRVVLVTQAGQVLLGDDSGLNFRLVPVEKPFTFAGVIEGRPGELVLVGRGGLKTVVLN
jgi:photosystem II stability/assembly factor-like uncharacterized protein